MISDSKRTSDLNLLGELLGKHADELTDRETEAFASMRFDLQAYGGILDGTDAGRPFHQLSDKQRGWVTSVHGRVVPAYANLVSRGLAPRGREVPTPAVLQNLPKRPPPKRRVDE
jgi:hypothetical protein